MPVKTFSYYLRQAEGAQAFNKAGKETPLKDLTREELLVTIIALMEDIEFFEVSAARFTKPTALDECKWPTPPDAEKVPTKVHVCHGVTEDMTCRFNGACYGEICIAPRICKKKDSELTREDKRIIAKFNREHR